jgi:hypothetical protein
VKVAPKRALLWLMAAALSQVTCERTLPADDLPRVETRPPWADDCSGRARVSGFPLQESDLDPCFEIAQKDAQEGSVECDVTVGVDGRVTAVACPPTTNPALRSCLESHLALAIFVPHTDCAGRPFIHQGRRGIAWSAEPGEAATRRVPGN